MSDGDLGPDSAAMRQTDSGASVDQGPELDASGMMPTDAEAMTQRDVAAMEPDSDLPKGDASRPSADAGSTVETDATSMMPMDAGPVAPMDMGRPEDASPVEPEDAAAVVEADAAQACPAGQVRCDEDGDARLVCNDDNQTFERVPCGDAEFCSEGLCQAQVCAPEQLGCDGEMVRRCNDRGDGFVDGEDEDCRAEDLSCVDGRCADPIAASRGAVCDSIECLARRSAEVVCGRFATDILETVRRPFMRGANQCAPGTLSDAAYAEALRATNYGRWLAGVAEVIYEDALTPPAQECATIMANQGDASHNPPPDWACYTEEGARSASVSNIQVTFGGEPIADSIVRFFWDEGVFNRRAVGHRRWMQSPTLGTIGFGYHEGMFTGDSAVCLNVIRGEEVEQTGPPFIAYPAPGPFPRELLKKGRTNLPWSVAVNSPFVEEWPATDEWRVSVSRLVDGVAEALAITHLNSNATWHGRTRAVVFTPDFELNDGLYRVEVESGERRFVWETEIIRCDR